MSLSKPVEFAAGRNIAMKVPPHQWEETVSFYRDVIGLPAIDSPFASGPPSVGFEFGTNRLWIDRVNSCSHAEIWLQLTTDDPAAAEVHIASSPSAVRRDEIEPLPEESPAFWISSPASVIHLVSRPD